MNFERKLEMADFRSSGFDYLRISLAFAVLLSHIPTTCCGSAAGDRIWHSPIGPLQGLVLPMFFSLSGFLVAGSMQRCKTLFYFLGLRFLRIYPALAMEVVLSALLIGPVATALPLHEYFHSHIFWRYMANVTGDVSYKLPGVFADNPFPDFVNLQLWTVPWELVCYIAIAALILTGVKKRPYLVPVAMAAITTFLVLTDSSAATRQGITQTGPTLVLCFLTGMMFFLYAKNIPWNWGIGLSSAVISVLLIKYVPYAQFLILLPVGYLTCCLGLSNPRRLLFIGAADYSYGVYLYGFVIQQFIVFLLPFARVWYINALIVVPTSIMVGMASWHLVEKPALAAKPLLKRLETKWLEVQAIIIQFRLRA